MGGISKYLQEICLGLGIVLSSGLGFAATLTWTNPAGGNWHTGTNWDTGNVPVNGDDAVIGNIGGNTVTYSSGTTNLNSFSAGDNLRITGGTLNVASASNVDAGAILTLSGGELGGAGSVTVNGNFDWGSAGSLSVAGGVVTKATTNLIGAGDKDLETTWDNDGTVNFNEGDFDLQTSNAVFNNNATFNIVTTDTDDVIEGNASGTAETFRNFGDLNKPNSGTIRILPGTFNNSGNVDIDMGTLKIESPNTTHTGTYDVAGNATLQTTATNPRHRHRESIRGCLGWPILCQQWHGQFQQRLDRAAGGIGAGLRRRDLGRDRQCRSQRNLQLGFGRNSVGGGRSRYKGDDESHRRRRQGPGDDLGTTMER